MEVNRKIELLDAFTQLRGSAEVAIFQVASLPSNVPDKDFTDAVCTARYALYVLRLSMSYLNSNSACGTAEKPNTVQYANGMCALASTSRALPNSTPTLQSFCRGNQQQQQSDQRNSSGVRCITTTPSTSVPAVDFPTGSEIKAISHHRISSSEEKPEDKNNSTSLSGSQDRCDFVHETLAQVLQSATTAAQSVVEDYTDLATSLPCQENDVGNHAKETNLNSVGPMEPEIQDETAMAALSFAREVLQPTTAAQVVQDCIEIDLAASLPCEKHDLENHAKETNPSSDGSIEPESQEDEAVMAALSSGRILRPRRVVVKECVIAEPVSKRRKRSQRPKSSSKKQAHPACGPGKKTALGTEKSTVRNYLALGKSPTPKVSLSASGDVNIYLAGVSGLVPIFFNNGFIEPYGIRKSDVCAHHQYVLFDSERFRPSMPYPQDLPYCTTVSANRRSKLFHRYYWGESSKEKWTYQHSELVDLFQSRSITPTLSSLTLKQGECVKFLNEEETVAEVRRRYGIKMRIKILKTGSLLSS